MTNVENCSLLEVRRTVFFVGTEVVPVFIVMVWFYSIIMTGRTWHRRLKNSCKISVGKSWTILLQSGFDTQKVLSLSRRHFSGHRFTCDEVAKHATVTWLTQEWRSFLCVLDGQTYCTLWQLSQPSRGQRWKIRIDWHI